MTLAELFSTEPPEQQAAAATAVLRWLSKSIFENPKDCLLTLRQAADNIQHVRRKVRMTETTKTGS